jgi:tyrosinase
MLSRREVFQLAGASMAIATLGGSQSAFAATAAKPVRRDINDVAFGQEATDKYRRAVGILQELPSSDSRNWLNLSEVHKNFCPHGNWYFLPWHRAYLSSFENICRDVLNDGQFALPYWDWSMFRQLPPGFIHQKVDGADNPLFYSARAMKGNDTLSSTLGAEADVIFNEGNIATILEAKAFQDFGSFMPVGQNNSDSSWQRKRGYKSTLESGPHDYLHGGVGGDMANPSISPHDPIFYLHHANLDRLWAKWNSIGGENEQSSFWTNFVFKGNFPLADGNPGGDIPISKLVNIADQEYRYEDDVAISISQSTFQLNSFTTQNWVSGLEVGKVSELIVANNEQLSDGVSSVVEEKQGEKKLVLLLDGVTTPANIGTTVRVFLNCDYLTPATPLDDPHYATSFTFFVAQHDHATGENHSLQSFAIDITETARNLAVTGGRLEDGLAVQLLPLTFDGKKLDDNAFSVASIQIATI